MKWYIGFGPGFAFASGGSDVLLRPMVGLDYKINQVPINFAFVWHPSLLDGATEKMDAINKKVFGEDQNTMHTQAVSRNDLRVLQGGKLTQQLDFK